MYVCQVNAGSVQRVVGSLCGGGCGLVCPRLWEQFQTSSSLFSRDRTILLPFRLLQFHDRVHEVKPYSAEQ